MGDLLKNYKILVLFIFCSPFLYGQNKTISIPTEKNGTPSSWFQKEQVFFKKIGYKNLTKSKEKVHFRFSSDRSSIDIWSKDSQAFFGTYTLFARTYDPDAEVSIKEINKPGKLYFKKSKIDTAIAKNIYNLFMSLEVFNLLTGDSIKGWETGCDGVTLIVEYSTPTYYSFKDYWTPSAYKNQIKDAAIMDTLYTQLKNTLQQTKSFDTFLEGLPYGCYSYGGSMYRCRQSPESEKSGNP